MLDIHSPPVFALSDAFLAALAALRPVSATFWGIPGHDDAWDDFGPEGAARAASLCSDYRERLAALPPPADKRARLATLVMRDFIDVEMSRIEHREHLVDLNNIASPFQTIRMVFDVMDTGSREGWERIIRRLMTIDKPCASYRAALEEGRRAGETAALRQVTAVIAQGQVHAGKDSFFHALPAMFAKSPAFDAALAQQLERAAEHAARSYGALTGYLTQVYRPFARETDAVGAEAYVLKARRFLGLDIDPHETFAWGWSEIRTIAEQMREVAAAILPGASMDEVVHLLETDPARCARGAEELAQIMSDRQARALAELDGVHFDVPDPVRRVDVKLAPPGSTLGAYYIPPSDDFSRAGTVWYAPGDSALIPLYSEVSTAYHEGFPGHHLQCGLQVSLQGQLSRLHRLAQSDLQVGYAEGWALYAERLMGELGYHEKPDYLFGMLACQMVRACRVVLDIGAHLGLSAPADAPFRPGERIDFEFGVDMLTRLARLNPASAASEMTRYLGWPGQAIAYKVGEREILALRDELRARRGASFDRKVFHAELLSTGAIGLGALRELLLA